MSTKYARQRASRPWRIDEDNEHRIVVTDDCGRVVHHAEYSTFPDSSRKAMAAQERINSYAMVDGVNQGVE